MSGDIKLSTIIFLLSTQIVRSFAVLPIPRLHDILDPELKEEFAILKKSGIFAGHFDNVTGEQTVGTKLNFHNEKRDLASEPDLWGEPLNVKGRQLGRSQVQQGPDGSIMGFKDAGDFVPWRRNTSKEEEDEETTTEELPNTPEPEPDIPFLDRLMPKYVVRASSLFGACGKPGGRTCFAYPDGCIEKQKCRIAAAIFEEDNDPRWFKVSLAATAPHGFVAIGFSKDRFMGDDVVVYCNHIPSGPQMTLHLGWNHGYENIMQKEPTKFEATLNPTAGFAQSNSVIACEFDMSAFILLDHMEHADNSSSQDERINLLDNTTSYHVFLAYGRYYDELSLNDTDFGTMKFHHLAVVSKEKIKFLDIFDKPQILHARDRANLLWHIIPSILAFSFFEPCAIFVAKYGREALGKPISSRNTPLWLLIHMVFHGMAMILSVIGLIGIVIELDATWRSVSGKAIFHSVFGIFGTVFLWFNAIFGACGLGTRGIKAGSDSDQGYHYVRWMHWYFGNCVWLFGMGCLFIAPYLRRAHAPCLFQYVAVLQILIHISAHLFMSFYTYWMVHKLDGKHLVRRVCPGPMIPWVKGDMTEWEKVDNFHGMVTWCGRRRAVIFYVITSFIIAIGMIALMFVPLVLCLQT